MSYYTTKTYFFRCFIFHILGKYPIEWFSVATERNSFHWISHIIYIGFSAHGHVNTYKIFRINHRNGDMTYVWILLSFIDNGIFLWHDVISVQYLSKENRSQNTLCTHIKGNRRMNIVCRRPLIKNITNLQGTLMPTTFACCVGFYVFACFNQP